MRGKPWRSFEAVDIVKQIGKFSTDANSSGSHDEQLAITASSLDSIGPNAVLFLPLNASASAVIDKAFA
jgi:hypothetical protein